MTYRQEEFVFVNKNIDVQARRFGISKQKLKKMTYRQEEPEYLTKRLTDGQEETVFFVDKIDMWFFGSKNLDSLWV